MNKENYILDALEIVLTSDFSDEDFAHAVNQQAQLMAGVGPDEPGEDQTDIH